MSALKDEPWEFASLDEVLALAAAMEQQAIDGYVALSKRMAELGHPALTAVFDALVREETGHLGKVREWRGTSAPAMPAMPAMAVEAPRNLFDDEGAAMVAPELLTAYRAFSMAVRNEERAFMFWTYVSANAQSDEIRQAAERMAREELGHVATLRRERRKAFHLERSQGLDVATDLVALERRLGDRLETMAAEAGGNVAEALRDHARSARMRSQSIETLAFGEAVTRKINVEAASGKALLLCEHLLDCYLDLGDRVKTEDDAGRARNFAAQIIACIRTVRAADL